MTDLNSDVVVACVDLTARAGARDFEIGYLHDDVPPSEAGWWASAGYQGTKIMTEDHSSPEAAALALAQRLLSGATCRCGKAVHITDARSGCRWRLVANRWEPGCDEPPFILPKGTKRGDLTAMWRAVTG